jgi:hypothetical protein
MKAFWRSSFDHQLEDLHEQNERAKCEMVNSLMVPKIDRIFPYAHR